MSVNPSAPIVAVEDLSKHFPADSGLFSPFTSRRVIHAVDGISFEIKPGRSLGLVGESGCGKTTTGRLLLRLLEPTAGRILMQDENGQLVDISHLSRRELRPFRRRAQMIFQDPYESLNPRRPIVDLVAEPLAVQRVGTRAERRERVLEQLDLVGLTPPETFLERYPHELSGGQRQRVAIARALTVSPRFMVADEPTSMLDVSIRIGIMQLLRGLTRTLRLSYLYITHDLAIARYMCDEIAVMYRGKIIEQAPTERLLADPQHPYTKALLEATPVLHQPAADEEDAQIEGQVERPVDPPPRCRFYERCPLADDYCRTHPHPPLEETSSAHFTACYKVTTQD